MKKLTKTKKFDFCFKHWSNKPYAAFNSIKKVFKMGVMCVTYSLVTLSYNNALALSDTITVLDDALVTAEKRKMLAETGKMVFTIERAEIETLPANSLSDLLKTLPGVDVRSRGQDGVQANISIRGGIAEQTIILLNGINITDPQTGHYNGDIPINLEDIDRIEVLEGAGSRAYGSGAFTGAINIITGEKSGNELTLKMNAGKYSYKSHSASGKLKSKKVSFNGSYKHSDYKGHAMATDHNINNFYTQTSIAGGNLGRWQIQTAWQDKAYGANSFYSPAFKNQFDRTKTALASLSNKGKIKQVEYDVDIYWRRHYDRYELIKDSTYGRNFHRTDSPGASGRFDLLSKYGITSAGGGFRSEMIKSTNLGTDLKIPQNVDFANGIDPKPQYTKGANRNTSHIYINQATEFGRFKVSAGLQGVLFSDYDFKTTWGINNEYKLNKIKLTAGVNTAQRLPSFTELYYKGPGYTPPKEIINPEKSTTYEAGVQFYNTKIILHRRYGKSIIDWIKQNPADNWTSSNITKVINTGVEANTKKHFNKFVNYVNVSAMWQTQSKSAGQYISKYTDDYLKYKLASEIEHKIFTPKFKSVWRAIFQKRNGTYTDFDSGKETRYPAVFIADFKINYTCKALTVFVLAENFTNAEYTDYGNIRQPGIRLKGGMSVLIK